MAKKPRKQVSLPVLPVFKKFSLAVRQETADGEEVLASLKASLAAVEKELERQPEPERKGEATAKAPKTRLEVPEPTEGPDGSEPTEDDSVTLPFEPEMLRAKLEEPLDPDTADLFFGDPTPPAWDEGSETPTPDPRPKRKPKPKPKPKPQPQVVRVEDFLRDKGAAKRKTSAPKKTGSKRPAKRKTSAKKPAKRKSSRRKG